MNGKQLKNSILQLAIQGNLVPQDPKDESASVLLESIRKEKERLFKESKLKKKDLVSTPITEDEKPFEIPKTWEWVRLGEICYLVDGEKKNEKGLLLDAKFLRGKTSGEYLQSGKHVKQGDNIILVDGENSGEVFNVPIDGIMGSTFKQLIINSAIHKQYLLMQILNYKELLRNSKKGAAIPHLNKDIFRNLPVGLPPLAEQHRIVEKIEELMPLIEEYDNAQKQLDRLNADLPEALKKSILQEAIQGKLVPQDPKDEPASVLLESIRKEKERLFKEGKLKKKDLVTTPITEEEKPFEIPKTWEWVRLGEICYLVDGEKKNEKGLLLDAKFLRGKTSGEYLQSGKHVKQGDNIILVDGENSGEVFNVPIDGIMGSTFKQLIINSAIHKQYLLMQILNYKELLRNSKKGAAIPHLNKDIFRNLPVGLPPLAEQHRIVEKIEELFAKLK